MADLRLNLRLSTVDGQFIAHLPEATSIEISAERNDTGTGKFIYPWAGAETQRLIHAPDGIVTAYSGTQEIFSFLLEDDEDDAAHDALTARPVTFSGRGTLALFERGVIWSDYGLGVEQPDGTTKRQYRVVSAGTLIWQSLAENQRMGYCNNLYVDFGEIYDSAGVLWNKRITVAYEIGMSLLELITSLCKTRVCDVVMHGQTLSAYVPDTATMRDLPGVVIRRAHTANAQRKQSRRPIRTGVLAIGAKGWSLHRWSPDAAATYGPRLGRVAQGNTTDTWSLEAAANQEVFDNDRPHSGQSISLKIGTPSCPIPWTDFRLGDSIRSDSTVSFVPGYQRGYDALRVNSIGYSASDTSAPSATVDVNDSFEETLLRVTKETEALTSFEDISYVTTVFEAVIGAIGDLYRSPGMFEILGNPYSQEQVTPDNIGRYVEYDRGAIYWRPDTGAHEVYGPIYTLWFSLGREQSAVGYPMTGIQNTADGVGSYDTCTGLGWVSGTPSTASMYYHPRAGAHEVHGDIRAKWAALNWENGFLGYPLTNEMRCPDGRGRFNTFERGSIYWTPQTGACEVHGDIRERWRQLGWETSLLGYPTSDEATVPGGRYNTFEHGAIYWRSDLGAYSIYGSIYPSWVATGGIGGHGFPTSGEYDVVGGRDQNFVSGIAHWDAATNIISWH